jgi:NitT/TauT family transport system permease protein
LSLSAFESTTNESNEDVAAFSPTDPGAGEGWWWSPWTPVFAAVIALWVHEMLPNQQATPTTRAYPALVVIVLAMSLVVAVLQSIWRKPRAWVRRNAPLAAGAIVLMCLWDVVTLKLALMPLPYFPGPEGVLSGMIEDRDLLIKCTWHSLQRLLTGYVVGACVGVFAGVLIGWFRIARYWGMPILKSVGPIPATAYLPLVMVLFANPFLSASALIALSVWFPVAMLTVSGIANVPVSYLDVARTLGAGRVYMVFRVAIPAALPSIFIGLFMGLGASFLALMAAETVGVEAGLGWYLKFEQGYAEYAKVYAALILMAVFFSGLMTALFKVRDWALGWQRGVIRW